MTRIRNLALAIVLVLGVPFIHAQADVSPATLTFTTIDVPGAGFSGAEGINKAGDIVGYYGKTNSGPFHAFLLSNGNFTYFDYPGASSTLATGINDSGLIVGYTGNIRVRGFLYDGTTFTSIRDGSDGATFTIGIDNAGDVVGGAGTVDTTTGFELRGRQFKNISPPPRGWIYVYATGINNLGEVVGWTSGASINGFSYQGGKFQTISFPAAGETEALGINDSGVIIGWYLTGGSAFGFALINGQYTPFGYPGAKGTLPRGINASGQVVGEYTYDFNTYYGFVTTPITSADFQ